MTEVVGKARLSDEQIEKRLSGLHMELMKAQQQVDRIKGQIAEATIWANTIRAAREEQQNGRNHQGDG